MVRCFVVFFGKPGKFLSFPEYNLYFILRLSPETTLKNGAYLKSHTSKTSKPFARPKYVIEREIPGAGKLTPDQLQAVSQTSCGVLRNLGPQIQWLHSYVTGDKIYCVYIAPNEEMVREHAKQGGFPVNVVSEVVTIIDPTTAE